MIGSMNRLLLIISAPGFYFGLVTIVRRNLEYRKALWPEAKPLFLLQVPMLTLFL